MPSFLGAYNSYQFKSSLNTSNIFNVRLRVVPYSSSLNPWIDKEEKTRVNPKKVVLDHQSSMDLLWKQNNSRSPSHRAFKSIALWFHMSEYKECAWLMGGLRLAMKVGKGDGYQAFTAFLALVALPICEQRIMYGQLPLFFPTNSSVLSSFFLSLFLLCFTLSFLLSVPSPHPRDVALTLQN